MEGQPGDRMEDEIVVEREWQLEPIARIDLNDSTDDTFILLQHLSEGSHCDSMTKEPKAHIGPRPTAVRGKPGIVQEPPRFHRLRQLFRRQAAGRIQRWWRRLQAERKLEPLSEMRSAIACECGCRLF
jgi:hypothetical protein